MDDGTRYESGRTEAVDETETHDRQATDGEGRATGDRQTVGGRCEVIRVVVGGGEW